MDQEKLVDYFIAKTDARFDRLEAKVDRLIAFRVLLIGAAVGISGLVSVIFQIAIAMAKH